MKKSMHRFQIPVSGIINVLITNDTFQGIVVNHRSLRSNMLNFFNK